MTPPGVWPVWNPGAWLAGFIKRTFIHCYPHNRKALGLVFRGRIFCCVSHCKSMVANDPRDKTTFDPRGMVGQFIKKTTLNATQKI